MHMQPPLPSLSIILHPVSKKVGPVAVTHVRCKYGPIIWDPSPYHWVCQSDDYTAIFVWFLYGCPNFALKYYYLTCNDLKSVNRTVLWVFVLTFSAGYVATSTAYSIWYRYTTDMSIICNCTSHAFTLYGWWPSHIQLVTVTVYRYGEQPYKKVHLKSLHKYHNTTYSWSLLISISRTYKHVFYLIPDCVICLMGLSYSFIQQPDPLRPSVICNLYDTTIEKTITGGF
jgi:hypothetical protein